MTTRELAKLALIQKTTLANGLRMNNLLSLFLILFKSLQDMDVAEPPEADILTKEQILLLSNA